VKAIISLGRDEMTGYRVGRCGDWYVRARRGGLAFDLRPSRYSSFSSWDDVPSDLIGLTLDQTARLLGVPRGDLHEWGRG
jgi:hypothetical protein